MQLVRSLALIGDLIRREMNNRTPNKIRVEKIKAINDGDQAKEKKLHVEIMKAYDVQESLYKKYNKLTKKQLVELRYRGDEK